jgi:hypothetical protein
VAPESLKPRHGAFILVAQRIRSADGESR